MKRIAPIVVLMILLPSIVYAGPSLTLNTRVHEFGPVKQGELLRFEFKLTNTGDEDVVIEKLQPNWGVTAVRAGQGPIKPGETETISVQASTTGKSGKFVTGVRVFTNDPNMRNVGLVLTARIVPPAPKKSPAPTASKKSPASTAPKGSPAPIDKDVRAPWE